MYARIGGHADLTDLAELQQGVVRRSQLFAAGLSQHELEANLEAERWLAIGHEVILLQNAAPRRRQLMWAAVLDAGVCALGSHTSLELVGFRGFAKEAEQIHLVIPRGDRVTALAGVQVHESRRLHPGQIVRTDGFPRTPTPRSVLDAAAWQPNPRFAGILVAAAVQQRLVTPTELDAALSDIGRIRHKQFIREAVGDAAGGSQAAGEIDLGRLCRQFGLVRPRRQVRRRDASGRWRYLDAEWELPDGRRVVLEVDGGHHMEVAHWQEDMRRERAVVVAGRWVLRASNFEVRHEPAYIVRDLRALGVPASLPELSESHPPIAG